MKSFLILSLFWATALSATICDESFSSLISKSVVKEEATIFKKPPLELRLSKRYLEADLSLISFESHYYLILKTDEMSWIEDRESDTLVATINENQITCR